MAIATNLGFPRIGAKRELKWLLEKYWKGTIGAEDLLTGAHEIRRSNWNSQVEAGIEQLPVGDFSLYDHVLDWALRVGAVPAAYQTPQLVSELDRYFAMARGTQKGADLPALEMTKWFNTNYHYIVPEWSTDQAFQLNANALLAEITAAQAVAGNVRPVVLGPVSLLLLGKLKGSEASPLVLLDKLLPVYEELLAKLNEAGVTWVQWDEPILALDLNDQAQAALKHSLEALAPARGSLKLVLTSYFESLRENLPLAFSLPVDAVHLDLVYGPEQLTAALQHIRPEQYLSLGLVDGRNVWKTDLARALETAQLAANAIGKDRLLIAGSCSLLHSPVDLTHETEIDEEVKSWLAFARQKLDEISILTRAINEGPESVAKQLQENAAAIETRRTSHRTHNPEVRSRHQAISSESFRRQADYQARKTQQQERLNLPLLPTTTIGSFPQTSEVRQARAAFRKGDLAAGDYDTFLKTETQKCIARQESLGIDVLVHGEFERNDMVEYFGEQLEGFVVSANGWVQSYGSRCVKPPIIFGDVQRAGAMTVEMTRYAQSLTSRPVKGMLTGPVTILFWSFIRDDQPRRDTCEQIALAIRDEAADLEAAGIGVIQIDEPALREGLPLRKTDQEGYLRWAVDAFRLASSGVANQTQIHTHMCYCEFNEILPSIAELDADVISIETSRSKMELLDGFGSFQYPNEIGPGVYDIHSPRVPATSEMVGLLKKAVDVIPPQRLWVNPDCGLKTRGWVEVEAALESMVAAAREVRSLLA
ncbi:5-methyltetrahydropteroyltriglutamate--homocysteine S-methyltransferase [Blastopirellula marina]|uniref:5-methyltetrahydropteroyltriglutamate--homocysteine methyltransferase n=1 Tax=Blastopirellula marina TaxID=124 RepID=A0A2S8F0T5_9BACT|nr:MULTISPECIES: 5-methyltetrahydropteroyltriglutamate--homocysteine S-methyltransferase [Pirellulaceae]PQO25534.1 5-methyltetrahydropteroyltriglutamate--homocysteine S-methyltransferase [Blastopirellula marina]RCS42498.1 5-methyltetrahydropteroyltriglutamate--homocysteine S-methyltransferase [Bremerella cremea]